MDELKATWKPIDTAPKDGTYVIVYPGLWTGITCAIAKFEDDKYAKKPRPFWKRSDDGGRTLRSRDNPPTHWMPMPAAPRE